VILDDLSGTVKPGEFLAILGASGAGKTTLLNFLSGKDPSKNLKKTGDVLVNGENRNDIDFNKYIGYVQQDDVLIQSMTVREWLTFAAKLKLHPSLNYEEKVDSLIKSLKLEKASEMRIEKVVGGERKCTSIGVELITDPSLIFLDEPTTGLDSFTATTIVEVLQGLAISGRTVITTIHQPNSEIFSMFDQMMLMAQGHTIYMNKASLSINYFGQIGYQCPELSNPADYFMEMMSIEALEDDELDTDDKEELQKRKSKIEEDYKTKIIYFNEKYQNSELKCDIEDIHPEAQELSKSEVKRYNPNMLKQFWLLNIRSMLNIIRMPHASTISFITAFVIGVILILIYGQLGHDEKAIQSRNGVLFMSMLIMMFQNTTGVALLFPEERNVFIREQGNRMYGILPYFVSKCLCQLPVTIIFVTIFELTTYFILELNTNGASHFFIHYGYSILFVTAAVGW